METNQTDNTVVIFGPILVLFTAMIDPWICVGLAIAGLLAFGLVRATQRVGP